MTLTFTRWLDLVGGEVSKVREADAGRPVLTFFSDEEEDVLWEQWCRGLTPKVAAALYFERREP